MASSHVTRMAPLQPIQLLGYPMVCPGDWGTPWYQIRQAYGLHAAQRGEVVPATPRWKVKMLMDNERKFRSQTSDNMDRWKAEQGRGREKRKIRREKIRRERVRKKEDADARKGRKVAKHCVFPMICGSGGSKSRLAKAAGAEPAGHRSDEKLHAVVARSTFPSQNVQNTPGSDHFWKLRCRKSARRCGAKHISKSKVLKTGGLGPLLEVAMSKKRTPLWREAHFEVKMYKAHQVRTTFGSWDVEKVHAVVARSTFPSQKC